MMPLPAEDESASSAVDIPEAAEEGLRGVVGVSIKR
jgi:hypothetical protein